MKWSLQKTILIPVILAIHICGCFAQWIPSKGPNGGKITSLAINGPSVFAGTWGGGVYLSENNGESWEPVNTGLPEKKFIVSLAVKGNRLFAGISTQPGSSSIYISNNKGDSWALYSTGLLSNPYVYALTVSDSLLFAGTNKGVLVSSDNGGSWLPENEGLPSNAYVYSLTVSGASLFAGTWSDGVFISRNNGKNWVECNNGLPSNARIYSLAANGNMLYAGTNKGVFVSENNGQRWTPANIGLDNVFVSSLAVGEKSVYAGSNQVYTSPITAALKLTGTNDEVISVLPNPSTGSFVIRSKVPDTQISEIFITNAEGKELFRSSDKIADGLKVELLNAPKGLYLLHVKNENGATVKKVIVQ
jgi:hypothetical protein